MAGNVAISVGPFESLGETHDTIVLPTNLTWFFLYELSKMKNPEYLVNESNRHSCRGRPIGPTNPLNFTNKKSGFE